MNRRSKRATHKRAVAFSLVEVVLALGVIAIAITAILGLLPVALSTGHSAQDETRAAQIAEDMISAMTSQAPTSFTNVTLPVPPTIDLTNPSGYTFSADNDGNLAAYSPSLPYTVILAINPNPAGFDSGYASQVTVRVVSPPLPNPSATPTGNQTIRDYVRIISKY